MKKIFPLLLLLLCCHVLTAQSNFKPAMLKTNPVKDEDAFGTGVSINAHEAFLQNAITTNNDLYHLYGLLYLYKDYYLQTDFVLAAKHLFEAEKFAKASGKSGWLGIVKGYQAAMTGVVDNNPQLSIKQFMEAAQKCAEAKDSLCVGESYEQISTQYNALGDFKKAHYYFKLGAPLLRKFGTDENLSAAYNNYANVLTNEKNFKTAITYIDSAINIAVKNKNLHSEMVFRVNLGANYMSLNEFDKTLAILDYCEPINVQNKWHDNLIQIYLCRSITYEKLGRYKEALEYLNKHGNLKENVTGEKVKSQIAALEEKYKKEEQQFILNKKQLELEKSLRAKERYASISFSMLSAILLGLWLWRKQNRHNQKEAIENHKNLTDLTNLMIEKNTVILELEEKLSETKSNIEIANANEEVTTLYSQRILTDNDWSSFKYSFEKVYPGYIKKVRDQYPTITEAEERLFLCLKLNLKSKETALMLGISNDSVKKNRNRLRKRLNLIEKEDLEAFVRNFTDTIFQKTS